MYLYLWPCYVNEKGHLVVAMVDCNWDTWDKPVSMDITHNIPANFDGALITNHQPRARHDMAIVMAYIAKVNSGIFPQIVSFLHYKQTFDLTFF